MSASFTSHLLGGFAFCALTIGAAIRVPRGEQRNRLQQMASAGHIKSSESRK